MVKVMKSPNMISTTGRIPVIAAPTARPVNPASEIGVSSTRSLPNSSSKPERTLKGVPASATSSPIMQTVGSRRISSARASRIACAKVSSRSPDSSIDILVHFIHRRIRRCHRKVDCLLHLRFEFGLNSLERWKIRELLIDEPRSQIRDRIAIRLPLLFFLLRPVILPIDIADMVSVVAIGITEEKAGTSAPSRTLDQPLRCPVHRTHVLPVHACRLQPKGCRSRQYISGGSLRVMRIFRVEIVLADVNHRKHEQLGEVHLFIKHALTQRAFPKETH